MNSLGRSGCAKAFSLTTWTELADWPNTVGSAGDVASESPSAIWYTKTKVRSVQYRLVEEAGHVLVVERGERRSLKPRSRSRRAEVTHCSRV
jgi:hypothetical protein